MLAATDTEHAPWLILRWDDECRVCLNGIAHMLSLVPYEKIEQEKIKLPKRSEKGEHDDAATLVGRKFVPDVY